MEKNKILNVISSAFAKTSFKLKKHSPELFMAAGIIGVVVGAVMACKATTKVGVITENAKKDIEAIHKCADNNALKEEYSEDDRKKDLAIVYAQTGIKLFRLYAPSIILGTVSIASILVSHGILKKRNIALAAAYTAVDKSFSDYRKRVAERYGEKEEKEIRHNIKAKTFTETTSDETGEETISEKKTDVSEYDGCSDYARFFDESCDAWEKDSEYNLMFLRAQQQYANDLLKARGHLFLNEVYDMIGVPRTKAGQVVGWLYRPDDKDCGDNFVDFGIYEINREKARDFVNGYERSILLDFNVDGYIWDKM